MLTCISDGVDNDDLGISAKSTKLLLSMYTIGAMTSFVLILLCIRNHMTNRSPALIFALSNSLIILLAIGGQIDLFLKINNFYPITDGQYGLTKKFGSNGFVIGIVSLLFSFLTAFSLYLRRQAEIIITITECD
ncbi:167_t:CDS:2 [Entrophospora sp. SA101]|nr:167_t:CDS:2 [Entrophospora sp. SA101]